MTSPLVEDTHDHTTENAAPTGAQMQFAEGGNTAYPTAHPAPDGQRDLTDSTQMLVMLQLASFEGRSM